MNTEAIIREYIDTSLHLSLGTAHDGRPWVCEVHFVYDDQLNLYFISHPATRHCQEIAANPQVAGNIVGQHARGEAPHGIYFEGEAEMTTDRATWEPLVSTFASRLGTPEPILKGAAEPDGARFYKITVATWYAFGKFGDAPTRKYELPWRGKGQ